jgi:CheY-like chemotaxis protein
MQPPAEQPQRAPLVLVVDDSLTVRRVTQRLLVREGYRVATAKDGMEALERLADERPVVLLSDIEMPRMDGFDLLRNVRAEPLLAGLPVVMITSRTRAEAPRFRCRAGRRPLPRQALFRRRAAVPGGPLCGCGHSQLNVRGRAPGPLSMA